MNFWEMVNRQAEGEGGAVPAEAPVADAVVAETPEAVEAAVAEESASASKPPQGLLDRIGQLTRQKRELEERLAAMDYRQAQAQQQYYEEAPQQQQYDPRMVQMEIHRQAQEIAKQQSWKDTTDKIWNEGLQKYGDWGPQLNNMATILGGIPTSLTEAAIESGNPHEVLYHLAKNPDEAARIALLPPTRQAVAVAKVAQSVGAPRRVSNAPPPISPKVNGMGTAPASLDDPNLSMEEWARIRNEQVMARRKGR